jgi:O-antigen/teichoic acid export membrane protein
VRWRIVVRNIFSNWLGYAVTSAIALLLAPFVIHRLGNTAYGVWTLVLSLTGYFGLLDFGIRSSVGRFVARYTALPGTDNVNRTVSTAMAILGCGSLLTIVATAGMMLALPLFRSTPELLEQARIGLMLAGLNLALALPMGALGGVLVALERYDILSRAGMMASVAQAVLVIVFLNRGHGIVSLAAIALATSVAQSVVIALYAKALYPALRISLRFVSSAGCKELLGFSAYRFIYIIATQLIFSTDAIVIGAILGAGAITSYAIAGSLILRGRDVVALATDTLYPAASRLDGQNNRTGLKNLYIVCTGLALLLGLPLCLGFALLGKQFVALWMGKEYAFSATVLAVLVIPQFTSMPQYSSSLVLASMAKHKILAFIAIGEGILNLILSIVLARKLGVIGVAWGTVIPHLLTTGIVIPLYTLRVLDMSVSEYLRSAVLRPVLCAVPVGALCYVFSAAVPSASWGVFGAEVAAVCCVMAIMAYALCLSPDQKRVLRGQARAGFWSEGYAK